jgi:hypothetical protein
MAVSGEWLALPRGRAARSKGARRPTTDDRRPTTDDRRPTTDDRRPTTGSVAAGLVPAGSAAQPFQSFIGVHLRFEERSVQTTDNGRGVQNNRLQP